VLCSVPRTRTQTGGGEACELWYLFAGGGSWAAQRLGSTHDGSLLFGELCLGGSVYVGQPNQLEYLKVETELMGSQEVYPITYGRTLGVHIGPDGRALIASSLRFPRSLPTPDVGPPNRPPQRGIHSSVVHGSSSAAAKLYRHQLQERPIWRTRSGTRSGTPVLLVHGWSMIGLISVKPTQLRKKRSCHCHGHPDH
jgi:hypothetical protein